MQFPVEAVQRLRWSIDGWTPPQALAALRTLEREAFGANAVPLFAAVELDSDGLPQWSLPVPSAHAFYELDAASRENLKARIGRRVGELRRCLDRRARDGDSQAPRLAALVRQALEVPGWGSVHAVAGEPVLAGWGHIEAGRGHPLALLIGLDDGIVLPAVLRSPWGAWLAAAAALAALFLAGLATAAWAPLAWLPVEVEPPRCKVTTADIGLFDGYNSERDALDDLQRQLAEAQRAIHEKTLACPVRVVELPPRPPEPPPEPPKPPPPPPKKADLPEDKWQKKDLSVLEGCWVLGRDSESTLATGGGMVRGVNRAGRMCFDKNGGGTRESTQEFPGYPRLVCSAPVRAVFSDDGRLKTTQPPVPCEPRSRGVTWNGPPNALDCVRQSDTLALCTDAQGIQHEFRRAAR